MVVPSMVPPVMATLLAFCVAMVPSPRFDLAADASVRSDRLEARASFSARPLVMVVAKSPSLPRAAANSRLLLCLIASLILPRSSRAHRPQIA